MDFRIDTTLPATAAQLWAIFFDVQRVAALIPGCENVTEVKPLKEFSAVLKQKIGPFKLEVPTRIVLESHTQERQVVLAATGRDKLTGTTIDVRMKVDLDERREGESTSCRLGIDAQMQVAGRLASLGYPVVKKRSEELFAEFERRLRNELVQFDPSRSVQEAPVGRDASARRHPAVVSAPAPSGTSSAPVSTALPVLPPQAPPGHARPRHVELVLVWPRVGITLAVGFAVAFIAAAHGQSDWWWIAAPALGAAAGLAPRQD
jgi:carbon monoxide dehydrogenase subunit G